MLVITLCVTRPDRDVFEGIPFVRGLTREETDNRFFHAFHLLIIGHADVPRVYPEAFSSRDGRCDDFFP